MYETVIMMGL